MRNLQPFAGLAGALISNISHSGGIAGKLLTTCGNCAKGTQYFPKDGREQALRVACYKNEGTKGTANTTGKTTA